MQQPEFATSMQLPMPPLCPLSKKQSSKSHKRPESSPSKAFGTQYFFPDFCVGFPRWLSGKKKNLPAKVGVTGSIPGLGRSPGEGNGNLLQYSDLGNPMNEGLAGCSHGVTKESVHGSATEQNKQNVFLSRDCNS